ncbi:sugar-binding domain-containing protein [Galbibacter mesophilus]|uniref:sugar-binding domain-containing protein n=1 Tax=Galbibacter mesophilus TaxID=379069 RepID=UPI00191EAAFE|nr:sugar-binding domain-containing protein [Galbibacter mesophilus]MCM5664060.1 glycoside hydrolase family 2 [Galbibacter mesophilus]
MTKINHHFSTTIKLLLKFGYIFALIILVSSCSEEQNNTISLAGGWNVKLDSLNLGLQENWANENFEPFAVKLPGTLDDAQIGKPNTLKPALNNYVLSNLTRKHQYIGKAWYQRTVEIPSNWKDKEVQLTLERVIWESTVFVDGEKVNSQNSLIGAHVYNLSNYLSPGKHVLTILIDNANKFAGINVKGKRYPDSINQDMAHAYTNHTQIKWNGILGNIELKATSSKAPNNIQVYPELDANRIAVEFDASVSPSENFQVQITDKDGKSVFQGTMSEFTSKEGKVSFHLEKPTNVFLWDEFNPNLYTIKVTTSAGAVETRFGYREIAKNEGVLTLNGNRIFLRGNLECSIFPLTGHPPLEKEAWGKLIQQAKDYGLNHLRFHSWCPPKAAFEAADEAGFYFQVELPHWSLHFGKDKEAVQFLKQEAYKLLKDYGNHPSFVLMAMGNEIQGDIELLNALVKDLKEKDNRHLYATTAFSFQKPTGTVPEPQDDFFVTQWTDKGWIRGQGIFNSQYPNFNKDYSKNSAHINTPLISHEIGQYSVYPDMSEISKYTGVLDPLNFKAIKNDLEKKGMLSLADDFTHASGKLATILYKEEIERALKTPSFDGFQLLQLQDFPGQGTALVGLLNAFWESKGVVSAEEFREFNSELVPLIRFEKAVLEHGDTLNANIEIANFYKPLKDQIIDWEITNSDGEQLKKGTINNVELQIGNNNDLGEIVYSVATETAQKLAITVKLRGTKYKNSWPIWIYPSEVKTNSENVLITSSFADASKALEQGKNVLLNPDYAELKGIEGRFVPVFWSPVHFPDQPATMGLLMDENHEVFRSFPTDGYTNWQWWDLCIRSKSVVIDSLNVTPLVRVVDNFVTNHKLSNLFEANVGKGKLVFSSMDLISDMENRPVARQLRHSLLEYMESKDFNPSEEIDLEKLKRLRLAAKGDGFSTEDIYN